MLCGKMICNFADNWWFDLISFILFSDQFNTGTLTTFTSVDSVVKLCGNPVTT